MNVPLSRQLLSGIAIASTIAFAPACSGTPSSMSPTSPSASASASAGANFSPNPDPPTSPLPRVLTGDVCACPDGGIYNEAENTCTPPEPPDPLTGRFTGGGFQIDTNGVKITRGFSIHCDNTLTNNLEINWNGGNNFHIDKESLSSVECTLVQPPNPPAAGVSRIVATSPGTCNNLPATITFILEDRGEPGTNDRAGFVITGGCSLNLSERPIDGGNIQAHFDQPHK